MKAMSYEYYLKAVEKYDVEVVVFDLGGVLVEVAPPTALAADDCYLPDAEGITKICAEIPEVKGFETGDTSAEEFARAVIDNFDLPLTVTEFLGRYKELIRREIPMMKRLVEEIAGRYRLCCLSNTNPLHWARVCEMTNYGELFDNLFLSYELGVVKPDSRIFRRVLNELDVSPEKVMFFDDKEENVEAARHLGFCGVVVNPAADTAMPV